HSLDDSTGVDVQAGDDTYGNAHGRHLLGCGDGAGRGSDPGGLDRGDQDGAGPDVVEGVHDLVGLGLGDHGAHGPGVAAAEPGDGGPLHAGGDPGGGLDVLLGNVVVHQ